MMLRKYMGDQISYFGVSDIFKDRLTCSLTVNKNSIHKTEDETFS